MGQGTGSAAAEEAAVRRRSSPASTRRPGRRKSSPARTQCLFKAEVLQEIAEYAGNATNNGLKTVDEAAAMDEAEMATPDALD